MWSHKTFTAACTVYTSVYIAVRVWSKRHINLFRFCSVVASTSIRPVIMFLRLPPVTPQIHYCSDAETTESKSTPRRERPLRHTSPSPSRSRLLRIVRRNVDDGTGKGKCPSGSHNVKRCRSYHDIEEAFSHSTRESLQNCSSASGGDLTAMTSTAAVPSNASVPVRATDAAKLHLLAPEEPRQRQSSGGSQKLNDMFSLGFRFGGKGNKEKKKKGKKQELTSPGANPQSIADEELTVYR